MSQNYPTAGSTKKKARKLHQIGSITYHPNSATNNDMLTVEKAFGDPVLLKHCARLSSAGLKLRTLLEPLVAVFVAQ